MKPIQLELLLPDGPPKVVLHRRRRKPVFRVYDERPPGNGCPGHNEHLGRGDSVHWMTTVAARPRWHAPSRIRQERTLGKPPETEGHVDE